jgi:hypothetical protein
VGQETNSQKYIRSGWHGSIARPRKKAQKSARIYMGHLTMVSAKQVMWMMWKEGKHVLKIGLLGKDEIDYVHWQEIVVYKSF